MNKLSLPTILALTIGGVLVYASIKNYHPLDIVYLALGIDEPYLKSTPGGAPGSTFILHPGFYGGGYDPETAQPQTPGGGGGGGVPKVNLSGAGKVPGSINGPYPST